MTDTDDLPGWAPWGHRRWRDDRRRGGAATTGLLPAPKLVAGARVAAFPTATDAPGGAP